MQRFNKIKSPELFQGRRKEKSYFEGWYYKHTSANQDINFSIIPGVSLDGEDKHAFIQVIIGPEYKSYYVRYNFNDFVYSDTPFFVKIGKSKFSLEGIWLDIDNEELTLKGEISYSDLSPIKCTLFQPTIMGFFAYFRFMQCNHGVLSLNHSLSGTIEYKGQSICFDSGKGYIEKDWGTSFPKKYLWIQCNNFENYDTSLFLSIAHIPFLGFEFMGMIGILKIGEEQYRFATYNNSKIVNIVFEDEVLKLEVKRQNIVLELEAEIKDGRILKAPKKGMMIDSIKETLEGKVNVELYKDDDLVYQGVSESAGIERVNFESIINS